MASPPAPQLPVLKPVSNSAPRPSSSSSHRDSLTLARPPSSPHLSTPSANRSSSLAENFRHPHAHHHGHAPGSPRAGRTLSISLSQAAVNELLNNPPSARAGDPAFAGRDWRAVAVDEVVTEKDGGRARFVDLNTSVEDAIELLIRSGSPNVVLLRERADTRVAVGTFDYSDLNAYLLLGIGLKQPDEHQVSRIKELARKGREGKLIPVKDVKDLGPKEPLLCVSRKEPLPKVVEIFGSGIHRVVVVEEDSNDVVGVLTQLRLVEFFWENCRHFTRIEPLFAKTIRELEIGSHSVFAINGDKPLATALEIIFNEAITSLPVLDNQKNVVGNISHADVRVCFSGVRNLLTV
jgi:CBS domain-containing protein